MPKPVLTKFLVSNKALSTKNSHTQIFPVPAQYRPAAAIKNMLTAWVSRTVRLHWAVWANRSAD